MIENIKQMWAAEPKDYNAAAVTKKYVSMAGYKKIIIAIQTGAWASGATAAVTLKEATDTSGTGVQALAFTEQWNDETTSGTFVKTTVTSNTFNLTTANKLYLIEIDANQLDTADGFNSISVDIASPGSNSCFYGVTYTLCDARSLPVA